MRCILVLGGPQEEWIHDPGIRVAPEDLVVACDGGYPAAVERGWRVDLAVGDFDSYKGPIAPGTEVFAAPPMKDDTDAMLGARMALDRGCNDFLLLGAFGGRLDHTVANFQTMAWLCNHGASVEVRAVNNRAWMVENDTLTLPRMEGWHLSVFAWGGPCRGVTLRGVAYPLTDHCLEPDLALGVSNEFAEDKAEITAGDGMLLVIVSREAWRLG